MKTSRFSSLAACFSVASSVAFIGSDAARAAAISWDNGNTNNLWSDSVNWNPDSAASGNDITFAATGVAAAGTVTNIVDANTTINTLAWTNVGGSASAHTTQINSGVTLTVNGTISPSVVVNNSTTASSAYAVIKGAGSFSVTGGSVTNFNVGQTNLGGSGTQTLDMSGLASFSADVGAFNVGNGQRNTGNVSLATISSITATTIQLGGNTTTGGPANAQLNLGTTNTIKADTITVGSGRTGADLKFQTGLSGATVSIANRAGSGAANLNVGVLDTNASGGPNSSVDFSGGTLTSSFGTVTLGRSANGTAGGSATGTLTFGAGTLNATTMNVGNGNTGSSTTATGNGIVNMTSSAGSLTATTVTLGKLTSGARNNSANGTFNQNGGTAAITTLTLADGTGNTGAGMTVTGTYNLSAGTLKVGTIQPGTVGSGVGTYNRTINWTGGTIQNLNSTTDLTLASGITFKTDGVGTQKFSVDSSRSITVNSAIVNGTSAGGFEKIGAGTLTLNGTNTYSGITMITNGTLALGSAGSIANSSAIVNNGTLDVSALSGGFSLGSSQTISGSGSITGVMNVTGTLSPGNSPGTLATGSQTWLDGGDYNWQLANATGAAGTGYDTISITGALNLSSLTDNGFNINLWSLSSTGPDVNGNAVNFSDLLNYSWVLASTTGGVTGFQSGDFVINTVANNGAAGFSNTFTGSFSVGVSGNNLVLNYTAVPEPGAALLGGLGVLALLRRRRN